MSDTEWVMVPKPASVDMVDAWEDAYNKVPDGEGHVWAWEAAYAAMISAAPTPPAVPVSVWQPIDTAPKGGGADRVDDPKYVKPPKILLLFPSGDVSIGYWDWYYAEGGSGASDGIAWVEPCSQDRLMLHYGSPICWMHIPVS